MIRNIFFRITFFLFSFSFLLTLPFSIYNRTYLLKIEKLSTLDTILLFFSISEFIFYLSAIILYFRKSDKALSLFNLGISLSIFYMIFDFILQILYSKILTSISFSSNFGYVIGFLFVIGFIIYLAIKINKNWMLGSTQEIDEIGQKEN